MKPEKVEDDTTICVDAAKMYRKIVVVLDGSEEAECVLPHVEMVVGACEAPEVTLVRCIESIAVPYGIATRNFTSIDQLMDYFLRGKREAERYLKEIASSFRKMGIDTKTIVIFGHVSDALREFAARNEVDLLVIASPRRCGISRWLRGSVVERLVRSLDTPMLVVHSAEREKFVQA